MRYKSYKLKPESIKQSEDGKFAYFEGHAAMFNNVDSYDEIIKPGAFKRTLNALRDSGKKLTMLWQHFPDVVLGCWSKISEDDKGLLVEGELNLEVEKSREAYALLKQGAISGMSIGFETITEEKQDGHRLLTDLKLWESSLVTFPANEMALVSSIKSIGGLDLKSIEQTIETLTSVRNALMLDPSLGHLSENSKTELDTKLQIDLVEFLGEVKEKNAVLEKELRRK